MCSSKIRFRIIVAIGQCKLLRLTANKRLKSPDWVQNAQTCHDKIIQRNSYGLCDAVFQGSSRLSFPYTGAYEVKKIYIRHTLLFLYFTLYAFYIDKHKVSTLLIRNLTYYSMLENIRLCRILCCIKNPKPTKSQFKIQVTIESSDSFLNMDAKIEPSDTRS